MSKKMKKKKKDSAPEKNLQETGKDHTITEEKEQMTQEEERRREAKQTAAEPESAQEEKEWQNNVTPEERNAEDPEEEAGEQSGEGETAEYAQEEAEKEEEENSEEDARGYFKKKKEKARKKEEKEDRIAELTDMLQRRMAEFENYRRRTEKEKASMYDMGTRDTVEKLLPVIDNFERGLSGAEEDDPFAEGMRMIYKQMLTMLTDLGVTPIDAAGKEFDPNLHNAVMHVDDEQFGENIVAEELQKGYLYKDHVVRHSMVKVAN